jgi:WD40 repeat protein/Flp pilus assembly protein TadD
MTVPGLSASHTTPWAFSPDGREIVIGLADGTIVFHDLRDGHELRRWAAKEHPRVGVIAYSPTGSRLGIVPDGCNSAFVRDTKSGRVLAELQHSSGTFHLAWNPRRPNVVAISCDDYGIYIWDVDSKSQIMALHGDSYNGLTLAYHPGGEFLASRGWHHVLRIWDTRLGRMVLNRPSAESHNLAFDRTGHFLAAESTDDKVRILEFADAAECRTLVPEPFREHDRRYALAIDPRGHRLAVSGTGVTVMDLDSGSTLATLPVQADTHAILFDPTGAVLTQSPGLLRWPITVLPDGVTTIGPPQILYRDSTLGRISITADGRTIAAAMNGTLLLEPSDPRSARWLRRGTDGADAAISPDGRWVVTRAYAGTHGLKLWDARTGRVIHEFPDLPHTYIGPWTFSPDGRWLAIFWDGIDLLDTTTWKPAVRLLRGPSSGCAFAPDSRTVAFGDHAGNIILADLPSGRELARIEDPEQLGVPSGHIGLAFTPDGANLVSTLENRPYIRSWDLRAIRRGLADLRLDWDPPAWFGSPEPLPFFAPMPKPFRVDPGPLATSSIETGEAPERVVQRTTPALMTNPDDAEAYHQRGHALFQLKRYDEAVADFTAAHKLKPDDAHLLISRALVEADRKRLDAVIADAQAAIRIRSAQHQPPRFDASTRRLALLCNNEAWIIVNRPSARDPARAVALARVAVELTPDESLHLNTLGVALYRAMRYAEAVPVLQRSLVAGAGEADPYDLFFLAMARHRLGDSAAARAEFDRAVRWLDAHPDMDPRWTADLKSFRTEAEAVLAGPAGELPVNVFAAETRMPP